MSHSRSWSLILADARAYSGNIRKEDEIVGDCGSRDVERQNAWYGMGMEMCSDGRLVTKKRTYHKNNQSSPKSQHLCSISNPSESPKPSVIQPSSMLLQH